MDFEQIKKLLEIGGGKCAVYKEGEPGYVILSAAEFTRLFPDNLPASQSPEIQKDEMPISQENFEEVNQGQGDDFQIEECSLDEIKIEDLPL
jgi:hypothetical protein